MTKFELHGPPPAWICETTAGLVPGMLILSSKTKSKRTAPCWPKVGKRSTTPAIVKRDANEQVEICTVRMDSW